MSHEIEPIKLNRPWHGQLIRADNGEVLDNVSEVYVEVPPDFPTDPELNGPSMSLMVKLMERNAADTAAVTNRVFEDKDREIARLKAELGFIRSQVSYLCNQKWTPNPMRILDALYPDESQIDMYRNEGWTGE